MSIIFTDSNKAFELGEINTERGFNAKRNLFVFTATILIIEFNSGFKFSDLALFGLHPFRDNSPSSFGWMIVICAYLTIYWIYHYWQGWSHWYTLYKQHFKNKSILLIFGKKDNIGKDTVVKSRIFTLETTDDNCKIIQTTIDHQENTNRGEMGSYELSSIWYVRRQLAIFFFGVAMLTVMSIITFLVLCDHYKKPTNAAEQMEISWK